MGDSQAEDNLADPVWTFDPKANTEGSDADEAGEGAPASDGEDTPQDPPKDPEPKVEETKVEEKKEEKKEEKSPDTTRKEIQVREKSKTDFILERKERQLERAKADRLAKINAELAEEGIEDDDLDPKDEETVSKVIQKNFGAQFEAVERQRFENEISTFLSTNDVAKHATTAELARFKEYALHPSRAEVPYDELIVSALGASRLMEIGAQMEREASKKAVASKVGGAVGTKSGDTKKDFSSMTDEEFEREQMSVLTGGRK